MRCVDGGGGTYSVDMEPTLRVVREHPCTSYQQELFGKGKGSDLPIEIRPMQFQMEITEACVACTFATSTGSNATSGSALDGAWASASTTEPTLLMYMRPVPLTVKKG